MIARLSAAAVLATAALVVCPGCEPAGNEGNDAANAAATYDTFGQEYTLKGRVVSVPVEGRPGIDLIIHHQEIPEFVRIDGSLGMAEMAMPFPNPTGVPLEGVEPGMPVEFTFRVRWEGEPTGYWLASIRPLPPETELGLSNDPAAPGGPDMPDMPDMP